MIFVVNPEFGPSVYATAFGLLQTPYRSKLFDLTPARTISPDLFERLAAAWTAPPGTVRRLGIVLPFERWAMFRELAAEQLQPLVARGVEIGILYEQQADALGLMSWFTTGRIIHNAPAVVESLLLRWQPGAGWPLVLDTVIGLVHEQAYSADRPALLTDVAEIALFCGSAEVAEPLAREALDHLPKVSSAIRAKALRELGAALIARGNGSSGLSMLDCAIAMAALVRDPIIGATALCQSGLHRLHHGDHADAERRFRRAIKLLAPLADRRNLLATTHHNLAIALLQQGKADAKHHAAMALELRTDKQCVLADGDRLLLAKLHDLRTIVVN